MSEYFLYFTIQPYVSHNTLQEVIVWKIIVFIKELKLQSPYSSLITPFVT